MWPKPTTRDIFVIFVVFLLASMVIVLVGQEIFETAANLTDRKIPALKDGECREVITRNNCTTVFEDKEESIRIVQCDEYLICRNGTSVDTIKVPGKLQAYNTSCGCPVELTTRMSPGG